MKLTFLICIFCSLAFSQKLSETEIKLYNVIETFRIALIEQKDEAAFNDLFLHESITWSAIVSGKTEEEIAKKKTDFRFTKSNYTKFYKGLSKGDEEKFYHIKIDVRGHFSTISFDYSFNKKEKVENWGTEYWSLLLVKGEWKITSVTWTMNFEENEKCPFPKDDYFTLEKVLKEQ